MIVDLRDPLSVEALRAIVAARPDAVFGLTSGVFDLTHHLHLNYLERCAGFCDLLVVGVDSDDLVKQDKGPKRPIYNEIQRAAMVGAFRVVAVAFVIRDLRRDFGQVAEILRPIIFKNRDFGGAIVGSEHAMEVMIVPDVHNVGSTSMAVEKIIETYVDGDSGFEMKLKGTGRSDWQVELVGGGGGGGGGGSGGAAVGSGAGGASVFGTSSKKVRGTGAVRP